MLSKGLTLAAVFVAAVWQQPSVTQGKLAFDLVSMANGFNDRGASCSLHSYIVRPGGTNLYLTIIHLKTPENAKGEYDYQRKQAVKVIREGNVQDHPATKPASTENRAIVTVASTKDCEAPTEIIATAGRVVRTIQSCSERAAIEFEAMAKKRESENDRLVFR
jgi:hypothetical protein